jgi:hypothetical protein
MGLSVYLPVSHMATGATPTRSKFDLLDNAEQLPYKEGAVRDQWQLISPTRPVATAVPSSFPVTAASADSFGGGLLSFKVDCAAGEYWDIENSALAIDYVLTASTGSPLTVSQQIAPAFNTAACLFRGATLMLNNTVVEECKDQYGPQSTFMERMYRPAGYIDTVGSSASNLMSFQQRVQKYASDGVAQGTLLTVPGTSAGVYSIATFTSSQTVPYQVLTESAADDVSLAVGPTQGTGAPVVTPVGVTRGYMTIVTTGVYEVTVSMDISWNATRATADQIYFSVLTKKRTPALQTLDTMTFPTPTSQSQPASMTTTVLVNLTAGDVIALALNAPACPGADTTNTRATITGGQFMATLIATTGGGATSGLASEQITGQRLIHRPPLSLWYPREDAPYLAAGTWQLDMQPLPTAEWRKACVQAAAQRVYGTDYVCTITNVQLMVHKVVSRRLEDKTYFIDVNPVTVRATQISNVSGNVAADYNNFFDVPPLTQEVAFAFQDQAAGTTAASSLITPTMFKLFTGANSAAQGADLACDRLWIQYDNVTKPEQSQVGTYKANSSYIDNDALAWYQTMCACSSSLRGEGIESYADAKERGLIRRFQWPRDGQSRASRLDVYYHFTTSPVQGSGGAMILMFARRRAYCRITIQQGQVIGVQLNDV